MPVIRETQIVYTIMQGDSLYSIAAKFGSSVEAIQRANALHPPVTDPNLIYQGWTIVVPAPAIHPYRSIYIVKPGDSLYSIAEQFHTTYQMLAGINLIQDPNTIYIGQAIWIPAFSYEVAEGDSLFKISKHFNLALHEILTANEGRPGFSIDVIYPGYRLILPLPSSNNIIVIRPYPADIINQQVRVEGFARVFEANVLMQIRDEHNHIISKERQTLAAAGAPSVGYFSALLPFDRQPQSKFGELWVYSRSAENNRIMDLVQVHVQFMH